jgi:hypothetical protein
VLIPTLAFDSNEAMLGMSNEAMVGLMIPVIAISGALFLGFVGIICKTIRKSVEVKHKEESRREIAAYVAEGTMSPDDAYKILSAGTTDNKGRRGCC